VEVTLCLKEELRTGHGSKIHRSDIEEEEEEEEE
jgi:hypothetical protein